MKYDPRTSKELHPRCGVTRKRIFKSCEAALMVAGELSTDDGRIKPNRAYKCQYCGGWHLTSHPAFSCAGQINSNPCNTAPSKTNSDMKTPVSHPRDPLHGITLEIIINQLVQRHGWSEMGRRVPIRCFQFNPTVKSSLTFLRKTPWARQRVEDWFISEL
jgi:hypothetical protein